MCKWQNLIFQQKMVYNFRVNTAGIRTAQNHLVESQ